MRARLHWWATAAAMTAVLSCSVVVRAQVGLVEAGREVFLHECAACHGQSGSGYGPGAWVLRQRPPDLTVLSNRTTPFPRAHVRDTVTGHIRLVPSHGPSEMPYWRGTLDTTIAGSGGSTNIDALLAFIEHIQVRPYRAKPVVTQDDIVAAGASSFKQRCTDCHEPGRRARTGDYLLGIEPPDLTTLRERYAGPMDASRIVEMIARVDVPQTTPMPSWYHSLRRADLSHVEAIGNLNALAAFLASIQR